MVTISKIIWEKLDSEIGGKQTNSKVWRAKVLGGWLVRMHSIKEEIDSSNATPLVYSWGYGGLTFLPDSDHTWDGNSLP